MIVTTILRRFVMKRLAFVAAVLAVVGCSKSEEAKTDTATPAMAPAPAPAATDTAMKMDSVAMKKMADSLHQDSVKKGLIKKP
jgi:hypothetical protein